MTSERTCEKMREDGTLCGRPAVARIIPAIDDSDSQGWLACDRHADAAMRQMREQHAPELLLRVREIADGR